MRDIWIVAENLPWAAVLIAGVKTISQDASIVAFINGDETAAKGAISHGASKAYALPLPSNSMWEGYAPAIAEKAKAENPALIILSASKRCRDMAAQIAGLLDAPCFSDAKNMSFTGDAFSGDTMIYGGTAIVNSTCTAPTVLATVGAKDYDPTPADASRSGEVSTLQITASPVVTGRMPRAAQTVNLGEAVKVVGVGRGFVEEAELAVARELATAIGAEVACSRPIAEFFKWMPEECYIGISGQVLKPQLYLAVGISGQAQHYYGVRDAKTIVSINKDAEALMNKNSDYYIVGDWKDVIPAFLKAVAANS